MIKRVALMLICCLSMTCLSACREQAGGSEPEFVFRYAENQADGFPTTMAGKFFAERVKALTNGRIEIIVYPDEALGDESSVIEQLQFGGIDFSRLNLSPLAELDERYYALQLPYLYDSGEHMWRVLDGDIGAEYLKITEDLGLVGLSWMDAGARSFYTSAPVCGLSDMANMRIRVQENTLMLRLVESLGANPQMLRYGAVLSALQTGEIGGAENNIPSYLSMGHYLVARYFLEDEHTRIPEMVVASHVTMEKLSPDDRAIIQSAATEAGLYQREAWLAYEKQAREQIRKSGGSIIALSPEARESFRAAVSVIYDEFAADPDAQRTIQAIRDLRRY